MPRFEFIVESSTFLMYAVDAANKKDARRRYGAGHATYTGKTDAEETLIEINQQGESL